jgi:hypothetical protein
MAAVTKSTCTGVERPVFWQDGKLVMIDQRDLPGAFTLFSVDTVDATIKAIKDMAVRGAPAIGAAGAFGLALAANASPAKTACVVVAAAAATLLGRGAPCSRHLRGSGLLRRPAAIGSHSAGCGGQRRRRLTADCARPPRVIALPPHSLPAPAAARSWWWT